jgi:predicted membrane channel-forming protein YqfA (hemolysin III family)
MNIFLKKFEFIFGTTFIVLSMIPVYLLGSASQVLIGYILFGLSKNNGISSLSIANPYIFGMFTFLFLLGLVNIFISQKSKPDWLWLRILFYVLLGLFYSMGTFENVNRELLFVVILVALVIAAVVAVISMIIKTTNQQRNK